MVMTPGRINVKTIIANVIRDAQLRDVGSLIDSMIEWAYEAEILIGSYDTFIRKECEIEIKNNRGRLPHDLYQFISFKINNVYPEVTNRDFRLWYQDSDKLAITTSNQNVSSSESTSSSVKMAIEGSYIHVSGIKDATVGGIAYLAFDLDEDGYPLIKDGHQMAVTAYILWKMNLAPFLNGKLNAGVHDRLEQRWYWLCGQARGVDEMPDPKQLEYIASLFNELLPTASKNLF